MTTLYTMLAHALDQAQFWQRMYERTVERHEAFVRRDWPPPWALPIRVFDEIGRLAQDDNVTNAAFDEAIVSLYGKQLLEELVHEWSERPFLRRRMSILVQAIECHMVARYAAAIYTLLPQIEGTIGEALGRAPNPQNDALILFGDTPLSTRTREYYLLVARSRFSWAKQAGKSTLARNAILHGQDVDFGTAANSVKLIITFDAIQNGVADLFSGTSNTKEIS